MTSSPGFGSSNCHIGFLRPSALRRIAFATPPPSSGIKQATVENSPAHSSIGTPSPNKLALTDCQQTVSGSISLPSRGTFHLSFTVLVRYRSLEVFSLGRWPGRLPTKLPCFVVLWSIRQFFLYCAYETITLYGHPFQNVLL